MLGTHGKTVYVVHEGYIAEPDIRDWRDAPVRFTKTSTGVYCSAKAARAGLREAMGAEILSDEAGPLEWADVYYGPPEHCDAAVAALLRGEEGAEDAFDFPWHEDWNADGSVKFYVPHFW